MKRLLTFSCLILLLSACAKSPGFKASDYTYSRVAAEMKPAEKNQAPALKRGSVVRESNKIEFNPTDTKWDKDEVQFKANVKLGDTSYGEVEFKGTKKDSKILLTPVDQSLNEKLKAQVVCTSEGDSCDDFFIDVFYKDNDVIYEDQIIPKPKVVQADPAPSPTQPQKNGNPTTNGEKNKGQTPPAAGASKNSTPSPQPNKNTAPKKPMAEKQEEVISDGIEGADLDKAAYVGISDDEIRDIFQMEKPATPEPADETPATPPPAPESPSPKQSPASTPSPKSKSEEPKKSEPKKDVPPKETSKDTKKDDSAQDQSKDQVTDLEKLRVKNQVFGLPSKGWLKNGTDFLKLSAFPGFHFFIANPKQKVKDYFGAFDVALVLKKLGDGLQTMMPGRKLAITAISKWGGGRLAPHEGHQNGTDVDVRYLTNNENQPANVITRGRVNSTLLVSNQWKLLKLAYATNMVDVMFVDSAIKKAMCEEARRVQDYKNGDDDSEGAEVLKRLQTWGGHTTHFHIRIRCSSDNPGCRRVPMVFNKVGC